MTQVQSMQPPCRICASMYGGCLRDIDEGVSLPDDVQPFRFKPYGIPLNLKNRDQTKKEIYVQCDIGVMRQLSAEETEEK